MLNPEDLIQHEFTFHFQKAPMRGVTIEDVISAAKAASGIVVLRGDAVGSKDVLDILKASGVPHCTK